MIVSSMTKRSSPSADEYIDPSFIFSETNTEPILPSAFPTTMPVLAQAHPVDAGTPGERVVKSLTWMVFPFESVRRARTNSKFVSVPMEPSRLV